MFNNILSQPAIFIGLIVVVGYIEYFAPPAPPIHH